MLGPARGPHQRARVFQAVQTFFRQEGAAGVAIGLASTIVVTVVVVIAVLNSPTWPTVRDQFFSWAHMTKMFPAIWQGFILDMKLFVIAQIAIFILSVVVAGVRALRGPVFFP